jgi:nitrite reductase/ring-hydroxylating ferredoxin subunit
MDVTLDLAEIPDGGAKVIYVRQGLRVALFRVKDRVAAVNDRCPHAGSSLGDGDFDGSTVVCTAHDYRFNVWNGAGYKTLKCYPVEITDQQVRVTLPD